jgi:hypothetical protein
MLNAEPSEAELHYDANPRLESIAEFRREGFLVVNVMQISQSDIVWCCNSLMPLIERGVGRKEGRNLNISATVGGDDGGTPQLCRVSLYASELSKWSYRKTGLAIAKQLLGPEASLSADNAFFKPSRVCGPTPWHQDEV